MALVKIKDVCFLEKGKTGIKKAIPGPYPMVGLTKKRSSHQYYDFDTKAVIIPLPSLNNQKQIFDWIHKCETYFLLLKSEIDHPPPPAVHSPGRNPGKADSGMAQAKPRCLARRRVAKTHQSREIEADLRRKA
jgi:hypothetical protein